LQKAMSGIVRSFRCLGPLQSAVLALTLVGCATAVTQDLPEDEGNGGSLPAQGGSGGSSATTGGFGGSGGKLPGASGSATAAGSGGQVSGGGMTATAGTTGTAGAAGTATTGTCPPYTGTRVEESAIFVGGFGTSTMGTWSGYGYTYKYGTATIAPGMGNGCFSGKKFCANGSVPAADSAGAGLGWNIGQTVGSTVITKVAVTTPVKITFAGATAGMRVQLSASSVLSYCYPLTAAEVTAGTATIPLASFKTECWGTTGTPYDGTPIEAIQLVVPGSAAGAAQTFDMCVLDVEPG
jgi:hypothetical protein